MSLRAAGRPDLTPYAKLSDLDSLASTTAGVISALGATIPVSNFVTDSILTVDQVLATYPAASTYRGRYIRASDVFGYCDGVMRCSYDALSGLYFWQPTTPEYGRSMAMSANMTLYRLKSPTVVNLTGTIGVGVTRNLSIDLVNGRPGETIEVRNSLTQILGTLNILGTGLGSGIASLVGGTRRFFIDWQSGTGLTLVQL